MNQIWSVLSQYNFLQRVPNALWSNEKWSKSKPFLNTMKVLDKVLSWFFLLGLVLWWSTLIKKKNEGNRCNVEEKKETSPSDTHYQPYQDWKCSIFTSKASTIWRLYSLLFRCTVLFLELESIIFSYVWISCV